MENSLKNIFKIETKIENKKLCFFFNSQKVDVTELRITKFIHDMKQVVNTMYSKQIKKVCFIFDLNQLHIPSNLIQIKEFSDMLKSYEALLTEKLQFTIIINKNNLFYIFFNLFKKYYNPVKPLYLCKTEEEAIICLQDENKRSEFPNIQTII